MPVVFGGVTPHPPLLIPEIGKDAIDKVKATQVGLQDFASRLVVSKPEVLLFVTPHGPIFNEGPSIFTVAKLTGDFRQFGAPQVKIAIDNYIPLARKILSLAQLSNFPLIELDEISVHRYRLKPILDHATMVPLFYFQEAGLNIPIVLISIGMLSYKELFQFGKLLLKCVMDEGKRTAMVASGDLSHRLIPGAPAGFDPIGKEFDKTILDLLAQGNFSGVLSVDQNLIDRAGECGFRPITIMAGAWEELSFKTSVLSYEGPFGVGYGVVLCEPSEKNENDASWLMNLAKDSVDEYVKNGHILSLPRDIPQPFLNVGAVFVSLHRNDMLRGCIGGLQPVTSSIANEVTQMAIRAATEDPRFPPVKEEELSSLTYSIDILSPMEKVGDFKQLNPKQYGVVVCSGKKIGLLLPDLRGVDTVEQQVSIAMEKGGIKEGEPIEIFRFYVTRYGKK